MSVSDWVCEEYEALIRDGRSPEEAARQVKEAAEQSGRQDDLWREHGEMLIQQIFYLSIRERRAAARRTEVMDAVPIAVAAVPTEFGYRHSDPEKIRASIFDGPIFVNRRLMRYGDMTAADWESKSREFKVAADNGTTRSWACDKLARRLAGDLTTEQCLSASEFAQMIPEIGF